jgi:hypothetical protein
VKSHDKRNAPPNWRIKFAGLAFLLLSGAGHVHAADFLEDIAPIFEARCIQCHQPNILKGEFSLATSADLLASGNIVYGAPDKSRLLNAISPGKDGSAPEMPEEGPPLSADQVESIAKWVASGAPWPEGHVISEPSKADTSWWSLQQIPDQSTNVPPKTDSAPKSWQANPVDQFLYATLAEKGLSASPEANRRTLIRRLYFGLLGLPPTFEAIRAFEHDHRPDAYEHLVDALLASPHYGERWARHWLDIAHYADSHGFERDKRRDNAYRYRDYVIRAFNDDVPYDQFLREQIAGDFLSPEQQSAVIATGFLAAGPYDFVGQEETKSAVLRRAARADDLDDMLTTVMTATMGLTVNCARCHDHKLDPIPQKDYFQIAAVFAGTKRGDRSLEPAHDAAQIRGAAIDVALAALTPAPIDLVDIVGGGDGLGTGRPYPSGIDVQSGSLANEMIQYIDKAALNQFQHVPDSPFVDGVFVPDGKGGATIPISSTGLTVEDLPATSGKSWDHILNGPVSSQDLTTQNGVNFGKAPHRLLGMHANKGITFDLKAIRDAHNGREFRFSTTVGYGGGAEKTRADYFVYVDAKLRAARRKFGTKDQGNVVAFDIEAGERFLTLIATDGRDGIGHDQVFFGDPQLTIRGESVATLSPEQQVKKAELDAEKSALLVAYPPSRTPERVYATLAKEVPPTHIQLRGNPETPGESVDPGALSCFESLPVTFGKDSLSEGERRSALAAWITNPANPLSARVWVNRLWHHHFGTGIVDTPSDFGFGGGQPSHPALLDWLAAELQRKEWSTKAMHRLIVTSAAYRQKSSHSGNDGFSEFAESRKVDGDNRLLWRMNPRRLEAEVLRDSILQVTGKLNTTMFGPGYRDFDYVEEYAPQYTYITADSDELWRRSIYRFVVRTTPQPFMTTLDCPNPAVLTPARLTTTTALQSLSLLNNDFMLKQAAYFAARVEDEAGDDVGGKIAHAFRLAFGREPETQERDGCAKLVAEHGLTALCRVLLNANEFVHID